MEDREKSRKRVRHESSDEFKRDAVEIVRSTGKSIAEVARKLGIDDPTLDVETPAISQTRSLGEAFGLLIVDKAVDHHSFDSLTQKAAARYKSSRSIRSPALSRRNSRSSSRSPVVGPSRSPRLNSSRFTQPPVGMLLDGWS